MTNYPNITINLYDPYPIRVLNIKQYDTGRGAMVTLTGLGGEVITPTGNGLYVLAKKRDGNIVYNTVTLVGNQIKIDFDEQMTVLSGLLQVEIQMIDAQGKTISTPIFAVNVMPSNINPLQIESTSEFGALTDALADVENLKQNGLKGDPGDAATIQVGTVTATDPGGNPAVTNSGTEQDAVLDFTLPRGEPGSIWYQGSAITGANTSGTVFTGSGIANAELNDMYLNTGSGTDKDKDKGNVYVCVLAGDANTAKWAYKQNIMGPTGPAGTANASSVAYNNESSGLTAGNVQGALDELTNKKTIEISLSSEFESDGTRVWEKAGIAYVNVGFKAKDNTQISLSNDYLIATGLPKPLQGIILFANKFNNGNVDTQPIRMIITTNGELRAYYTSVLDIANKVQPLQINIAYPIG